MAIKKNNVGWLLLILSVLSVHDVNAQRQQTYFVPTQFHGVFTDQSSSIRGQSLGNSMVNLDGVANFIYNPATIGPGENKIDVHLNYLNHHPFFTSSHYPFLGASYRVHSKLVVAASLFTWSAEATGWQVDIGGNIFDRVGRSHQTMISAGAAYTIIPNLHLGISANYVKEKTIDGENMNGDYLISMGAIYDRSITLFDIANFENEKVRVSASFTNILMNNKLEQSIENLKWVQTLPIYLRAGSAYSVSVPVAKNFGIGKRYYEGTSPLMDVSIHVHIKRALEGPDPRREPVDDGFGLGLETKFHQRFSLQLGYYSEQRAVTDENTNVRFGTSPKKSGLTWGIGSMVPVKNLTDGRFPFNIEVHLTFSRMMNELEDSLPHPQIFTDNKRQLGIGINLKWD